MKAKAKAKFRDRFNPENIYEVGDIFEGSEERIAELAKGGWVEPIVEKAPAKPRKPRASKPKE